MGTELNPYNDLPLMSGLIAIDKAIGLTSRDCVNHVERLLRTIFPRPAKLPKVGHAGTLDPLATGVLVVGVGSGVRLVPYIQEMAKQYDATFRLGCWSETGDLEGELNFESDAVLPTHEAFVESAREMIGDIRQTPPATSAVRIGGKQAYKYAHEGRSVVVPSRTVRVDSIVINRYEYPELDLWVQCGSGTYIRTLGMDLAEKCGTRAVMSRLRRVAIGNFSIGDCIEISSLTSENLCERLMPLRAGVAKLPRLDLSEEQTISLCHGVKLSVDAVSLEVADEAIVIDGEGELRAIVKRQDNLWAPYRVFHRLPG